MDDLDFINNYLKKIIKRNINEWKFKWRTLNKITRCSIIIEYREAKRCPKKLI